MIESLDLQRSERRRMLGGFSHRVRLSQPPEALAEAVLAARKFRELRGFASHSDELKVVEINRSVLTLDLTNVRLVRFCGHGPFPSDLLELSGDPWMSRRFLAGGDVFFERPVIADMPNPEIVEPYRRHLAALQQSERSLVVEKELQEASARRELMGILMNDDWLGMEVLFCLADCSEGIAISGLADKLQKGVDHLAGVLAQLVRRNAVDVQSGIFVCAEDGLSVVEQTKSLSQQESSGS